MRAGRRDIALWPRLRVFRLSLGHAREQRRTGLVPVLRSERPVLIRVARCSSCVHQPQGRRSDEGDEADRGSQ